MVFSPNLIISMNFYLAHVGTAIHVNKKFNNIERKDLKALNGDYESVWVEIKNKFSKNIVTGCIYRHPRYNFKEFMCWNEMKWNEIFSELTIVQKKNNIYTNYQDKDRIT